MGTQSAPTRPLPAPFTHRRPRRPAQVVHHDYPARIRDGVEERLRGLGKFHGRVVSMKALLERQREDHHVGLVANVGRGTILVADVKGDAFSVALDEAIDRMTRHLKRHHDKVTRDRHRGGRVGH